MSKNFLTAPASSLLGTYRDESFLNLGMVSDMN